MDYNKKLTAFEEQFKDHVLTVIVETDRIKAYRFAKPDSWDRAQEWVFMNGRLIVTGDCYDSIYSGGPFISIESASKCNLSYFSGKCVADRNGYDQSTFDNEVATKSVHDLIIDNFEHEEWYSENDDTESKLSAIESNMDNIEGVYIDDIPRSFDDEYDTVIWLRENTEITGDNWYDGLRLNSKNNHPYWHLAALKVAAKQLEFKTATEVVA